MFPRIVLGVFSRSLNEVRFLYMAQDTHRKKTGIVKIVVQGIGSTRPQRRTKKPGDRRGQNAEFLKAQFKKGSPAGPAFRKGFQRQRLPKFSDAYEVALMDEVPAALRKKLRVPEGTTFMDVLVRNVVAAAALQASIPHVTEVREVTQGKVANKNVNLNAELEAYATNPAFQQFLAEKLEEFRAKQLTEGDNE